MTVPAGGPADLCAVFVNFNTWRECAAAVRSLLASPPRRPDGTAVRFEVVVVDNASPQRDAAAEAELADALRGCGGVLRRSECNLGYAGGVALGAAASASPWLLVCNADVWFGPGALDRMVAALLADAAIAAVMPEGFWDHGRTIRLPADHAPSPGDALAELSARLWSAMAVRRARTRARAALRLADAGPLAEVAMLSGHCLLLRRAALRGVPFDPGYPLYYEDADLARRLRRDGHRLAQANGAFVVHLHDRSARTAPELKQSGFDAGRARYLRRWHGRSGVLADRWLRWLGDRAFARRRAAAQAERLPLVPLRDGRPVVPFTRPAARFVLLLGSDPWCSLPGIAIGSGAEWSPTDEVLASIGRREAYVRVFDAGAASLPAIGCGRLRGAP